MAVKILYFQQKNRKSYLIRWGKEKEQEGTERAPIYKDSLELVFKLQILSI